MTAGKEKENPGESDPFAGIPAEEAKLLPLKSDLIFKMVFGDARYIEILRAFLLAALDIPADDLADIQIIDPHLERDTPDDKLGILDVRVQMRGGGLVAVEIQRRRVPAMAERVTFSTCRNLSRQIVHGQGYARIAKVITIVITDYDMIPGEKEEKRYHHVFRLYDETHRTRLTGFSESEIRSLVH